MSKYTTEVRYICESYAGLDESVDYPSVDEVIDKSYLKIFNNDKIPMFNGETIEHRAGLLKKILLHYYSREIGYETVGLWKLKLNQKLIEVMPYYNQLYESEQLKFDPLQNVSVTRTHEGEYNDDEKVDNIRDTESHRGAKSTKESDAENHKGVHVEDVENATLVKGVDNTTSTDTTDEKVINANTSSTSTENTVLRHSKTTSQGNDTRSNSVTKAGDAWSLFSDTPQGGINGIANASSGESVGNDAYLTNATHNITTPDEQSVTQTHGNIVETYNLNGDNTDTTTITTSGTSHSQENGTTNVDGESHTTENSTNRVVGDTKTTENATSHELVETQSTENTNGKITDDNTKNTAGTDAYTNLEIGKIGVGTYSEMLIEFRKTFLNIDMMVIKELEPLFIGLW